MITRKPKAKPTYSPDRPSEQLQLVPISIEHKLPTRKAQPRQLDTALPQRSLLRGKMTLH